jgi:hypothetical protein
MTTKLEKKVERETAIIEKMVPLIVSLYPNNTMGFRLKHKHEEIVVDLETIYRYAKNLAIAGKARVV